MRSNQDIERAMRDHGDRVRRLCMVYLKNPADTDDVFQKVFLAYAQHQESFEDEEHEKAWFIRVTINACKDFLKSFWQRQTQALIDSDALREDTPPEHVDLLEAILSLKKTYREVIYLHYYEGYSAVDIAALLHKNVNSIYSQLSRARKELRQRLEEKGYGPTD